MNLEHLGRYAVLSWPNKDTGSVFPDCLAVVDVEGGAVWLEAIHPILLMQALAEGQGQWIEEGGRLHCMAPLDWLKQTVPGDAPELDRVAEGSRAEAARAAKARLQ